MNDPEQFLRTGIVASYVLLMLVFSMSGYAILSEIEETNRSFDMVGSVLANAAELSQADRDALFK